MQKKSKPKKDEWQSKPKVPKKKDKDKKEQKYRPNWEYDND